jgi:SNF2 family DNA or RNA helicase
MAEILTTCDLSHEIFQPLNLTARQITFEPTERPSVLSASIKARQIKVFSFSFGDGSPIFGTRSVSAKRSNTPGPAGDVLNPSVAPTDDKPRRPNQHTRLRPPKDVVRLSDRLYFLLQPPLEYLLQDSTLEFPFEPFNYQFAGISFMFTRRSAILADEMGLGKTMQAITAIRLLIRSGQARKVLLICPKPLVTNWLREFKLWAPELTVVPVAGSQGQREWLWKSEQAPVKIANYELLTRDQQFFTEDAEVHFDLVILDEAQRIKNRGNATSQVVRRISRDRSWALTGTPIENTIDDLIGIFEFVSPNLIGPHLTIRQIRDEVKDHIIRRTKDVVMTDMPPKLIRDDHLDLSPEQWETYTRAEQEGIIRLSELGDHAQVTHVFELVLRLKQICNFDPATDSSSKIERLEADLEEVAASGQKAIIFSQWVGTLNKIAKRLERFNPLAYHGKIPSNKRDGVLAEFKENPGRHVILMSYGAGSVGLNLQFCRYVFLFDRWWNPAIEDQAINRAHRIGAAGSVTVSRMISTETIEQRIHDVLEAKRQLFREILSDHELPPQMTMTQDEIFGLFDLRTPQGRILKQAG